MKPQKDRLEALSQQLILGTHRCSSELADPFRALLPADMDPGARLLASAALLAQHRRLSRRPRHVPMGPPRPFGEGEVVQGEARRLVRTLLGHPEAVRPVLRRLRQAGLRLNPFDLGALGPGLSPHADEMFEADRALLGIEAPAEASWASLTPKKLGTWFAQQRRADPAKAREQVEAELKSLEAAARLELVTGLAIGLGPDDRELLESLGTDRSKRVKVQALELLSELPGTAEHAARLERVKEDVSVSRPLLRKLSIGVARGVKPEQVASTVRGLGLGAVLEALGLERAAVVSGHPKIAAPLAGPLIEAAIRDDDADAVLNLSVAASEDWGSLLAGAGPSLPADRLAEHLPRLPVRASTAKTAPLEALLEDMAQHFDGPWSERIIERFIRAFGPDELRFPATLRVPPPALKAWMALHPRATLDPWLELLAQLPGDPE